MATGNIAKTDNSTNPEIPFIYLADSGDNKPRRTIRGQRRRPGSDQPTSGRAEAPQRDERPSGTSGGGLPPLSSGGGGGYTPRPSGGGMSGIPGGMRGAAGGGSVLLALCAIIAYMIFGGGGDGQDPFNTGGVVGPLSLIHI